MVHHGVSHHHHIRNFLFRNLGGKHQLLDQTSDLLANQIAELLRAVFRHAKLHAAHDVRPKARLGVQRRAHRQHAAGAEVKQLRDQRGGSQVHRHAQAGARLESKGRLIHQDGSVPLAQLDNQIVLQRALAGQSPSAGQFLRAQTLALRIIDRCVTFQHVHPAAAASALPAAGELHALGEQQVTQGGSRRSGQFRLYGAKGDAVCRLV